MKIRRIKVLLAKGWCKVVCFVSFSLLSIVCNHASAKKAGDLITGTISTEEGPLAMANVCERDSRNRIVAHSISDIEGRFGFRLVNPENKIEVTYIGYYRVELPIDRMHYEIKMIENPKSYLDDIIFDRKVQTINMDDFDSLGITTVDEALTGRVADYDILFESGDLAYGPPVRLLMRMMDEVGDRKPLVALDFVKREIDKAKLESFDFENLYNDRDSLASLLGVKKSRLKAVRYLKNAKASAMWGRFGENGVIEVITPKTYRKYKKEGKLENDWQILK